MAVLCGFQESIHITAAAPKHRLCRSKNKITSQTDSKSAKNTKYRCFFKNISIYRYVEKIYVNTDRYFYKPILIKNRNKKIAEFRRNYSLQTAIYGGKEREVSMVPLPQSKQLKRLFCECDESNGTDVTEISSTFATYSLVGNPK